MLENAENSRFQLQQEKEAEDESQRKGTVYDDVFRTMIDKMPHLIIPLINQVFSKQYPAFSACFKAIRKSYSIIRIAMVPSGLL